MNKKYIFIIICTLLIGSIWTGCIQEEHESEEKNRPYIEIASEFMLHLKNNNFQTAYSYFNEEMKDSLSISDLENTWKYFTTLYGKFIAIQETDQRDIQGYDVVYINCTFEHDYLIVFRIVFDSEEKITGFWQDEAISINEYQAPTYVNTTKFTELNITIGSSPWQLPATLSIPNRTGPFSCVILIHGSGPNDKDETIGPNKPFKDIAWGLASKGIVVLRYDKKTMVYPKEVANDKNFTVEEEVINDVLQAINMLTIQSYVQIDQIFILGHSLGGMLIPKIAILDSSISGGILMAAPARPLEELIFNQTFYLSNLDGTIDVEEKENLDYIEKQVQKIKTLNITDNEIVLNVYKPYWEYLASYDQVKTAYNLNIPLLILQGKRDYQVTFEDDFHYWNKTLQNNEFVSFRTYESLNHLFIPGLGIPTNEEYMIEGHVDQEVIEDIGDWIETM